MSGPKRNADKLNTIGIVVVGICGAVLVYVTIVALQAFYMNDTSELQTAQDYGNQDAPLKLLRADQQNNIKEYGLNPGQNPTYRVPISRAMDLVVESAKVDPASLVPALGEKANKPSIKPEFGRPKPLVTPPPPPPPAGAGSAAAPASGDAAGSGSAAGSAAPAGAGSAAAPAPAAAGSAAAPGGHAP